MSEHADLSRELSERVADAAAREAPLAIRGGGTKAFLGERAEGEALDVTGHRGIVSYEPGELVLTARAGTPLTKIEAALADAGQMLPFEPPHHGANATLGGTIAAGMSGPGRPFFGAARDLVLGTRIVNGRGEDLRFGGEVMKNVAGYDLSRLMAGAHGTLGVLLEISLKVLPAPRARATRVFEHDAATAIEQINAWQRKPWPITAAYWEDGRTYLRLAGAQSSVDSAIRALGGEALTDDGTFWQSVREQTREFFEGDDPLWRLSVAPATPMMDLEGPTALDWAGAQRWLRSAAPAETVRAAVSSHSGHASIHRGDASPRFHPLPKALMALHRRIKQSVDPAGILNRGRLYPDF
ncbi:glycolate oxidase subunit GlcE [Salinisphaera orenii]|uniref:FAD-binding protein n=1 Tax=Salinisphaera orenii YIM 95161 TaxID=1051139 RepID=A0A423Q1K4_9GAMM|nr:glycolate oxidase subunit GlcE [Salinisphaera halophila]ROO32402.1 FAD-binding protein [Salinisphaera halophila YIM 95161]